PAGLVREARCRLAQDQARQLDRGDLLDPFAAALPGSHHHEQRQALCADDHAPDIRAVGADADLDRPAVRRPEGLRLSLSSFVILSVSEGSFAALRMTRAA